MEPTTRFRHDYNPSNDTAHYAVETMRIASISGKVEDVKNPDVKVDRNMLEFLALRTLGRDYDMVAINSRIDPTGNRVYEATGCTKIPPLEVRLASDIASSAKLSGKHNQDYAA